MPTVDIPNPKVYMEENGSKILKKKILSGEDDSTPTTITVSTINNIDNELYSELKESYFGGHTDICRTALYLRDRLLM